jgi:hypothetical protein
MRPNYAKGTIYADGEAVAAIYADGTTFGDENVLKAMLQRRREMSDALTTIAKTVCDLGLQQTTIHDIAIALDKLHADEEKLHASEDAKDPMKKPARDAAYDLMSRNMKPNLVYVRQMAPSQAAKHLLEYMNEWRTGLADPAKDSTGQLMVPPVTPLSCNLQ